MNAAIDNVFYAYIRIHDRGGKKTARAGMLIVEVFRAE